MGSLVPYFKEVQEDLGRIKEHGVIKEITEPILWCKEMRILQEQS